MADILAEIFVRLREQLESLIGSMEATNRSSVAHAPPALNWDGPLIDSIRQGDPKWFVIYATLLRSRDLSHKDQRTHVLIVSTLLCLQRKFKQLLFGGNSALVLLCDFIKSITDLTDLDVKLWYKECVYSLIKSSADKPRIVTQQMESAGLTFQDQENLIKSMRANPQMASEAFGTSTLPCDEWLTQPQEADAILNHLISDQVISNLVKIKATPALACIARVTEYRKLIVRAGGARVLIDSESGDKEQNKVALARLCISTAPSVWQSSQLVDLANSCFGLLVESRYELYQFEACVGLTNLLSFSTEVGEYLMTKSNFIDILFDTISSCISDQLRSAVVEVVCNLSQSDSLQSVIAQGKLKEPVKILFFLMSKSPLVDLQKAAGGALAILTGNPDTCRAIENIIGTDGLVELGKSVNTREQETVLRVLCIIFNVIENTTLSDRRTDLRNLIISQSDALKEMSDERITSMIEQLG